MKTAELMLKLVEGLLGVKFAKEARCVSQYVGHLQRSAGAWSWCVEGSGLPYGVGSQWSMTELLRAHNSGCGIYLWHQEQTGDVHVTPADVWNI